MQEVKERDVRSAGIGVPAAIVELESGVDDGLVVKHFTTYRSTTMSFTASSYEHLNYAPSSQFPAMKQAR